MIESLGEVKEDQRTSSSDGEVLRRELRDGPPPGWNKCGKTAVKGADIQLEESLMEQYGGDPERDIPKQIVLSEN